MIQNGSPGKERRDSITNTLHTIVRNLYYWIAVYVRDIFCNFGNTPYLSQRALQFIQEFINELRKYYGNNVELLKPNMQNQFFILALLMNKIRIGDMEAVEDIRQDVHNNTLDIANYFASLNPNWSSEVWVSLIYDFIFFIRSVEKCEEQIGDTERLDEIVRNTADYISQGIIKQFNL
jgi:hypothetical protein